jgi:hypothetical protein
MKCWIRWRNKRKLKGKKVFLVRLVKMYKIQSLPGKNNRKKELLKELMKQKEWQELTSSEELRT